VIRIALTGSIGMGKSTVAKMIEDAGIPLFDADAVVRELQGHGGRLVGAIAKRFPGTVEAGLLDRDKLAQMVLDDPAELAALERIVHPAVRDARDAFIDQNRDAPALLFEIPLLFETRSEGDFDKVIVVSAPSSVQRARVLERTGMTPEKFESILRRQMPDEEKHRRADFVVDTGVDLSTTQSQVGEILACLGLAGG
jgi:dephospho-CoA kinase